MKSSDAPSIARISTLAARSGGGVSRTASIGRASSVGSTAAPLNTSGVATETAATTARHTAHNVRCEGSPLHRPYATSRNSADDTASASAPCVIAETVSGASTRLNVERFAHINAEPAAADNAPSHDSTPMPSHAGENSSRASSCRATSST